MRNLVKIMVALAVASPFVPCMADELTHSSTTTIQTSTKPGSSSSESVEVRKGVKFKFRERLHNLHEKIDTAVAKGWITAAQASSFGAEADRLVTATSNAEAAGWPKAQVDTLEKNVTKLNASLATASTTKSAKVTTKTTVK